MKKFMSLALVMLFVLGISVSSAIADANLRWDVGQDGSFDTSVTVPVGNAVTVDLYAADVPASSAGAATFEVGMQFQWFRGMNYVPSWLQCNSITVNPIDWPNFAYTDWTSTPGNINAGAGAPNGVGYTGDFKLITIEFQCLGEGTEIFDFTETNPDEERFCLGLLGGGEYTVNATDAALTIICQAAGNDPPVCQGQDVTTFKDVPVDITLLAIDDGTLTYSIESLPVNGTLEDSGNHIIITAELPYPLPDDKVTYIPNLGICNDVTPDPFTFQAYDGELSCATEGTVDVLVKCSGVQMVMPRLWPCTPPYHWWFENPDGDSADPSMTATPNEKVCFYVNYDAFDNNGNRERELSGIGFWVHFDPQFLGNPDMSKDIMHIFPKGYVNVLEPPIIVEEVPGQHHKFLMAWADAMSPPAWPNEPLPIEIFKVCFVVPDDATLANNSTEVYFTEADTAIGYEFYEESMTVNIVHFDIDIDKNGAVKPLTDGLLITRYLFGFMGNNLVSGAVDPGGQRTEASLIADWIERGRVEPSTANAGYTHLDIDANREVTPLTDGIMILRHLFGYTGVNLTSGAIGPNATQDFDGDTTILEPDEDIGAYINTLNPLP